LPREVNPADEETEDPDVTDEARKVLAAIKAHEIVQAKKRLG